MDSRVANVSMQPKVQLVLETHPKSVYPKTGWLFFPIMTKFMNFNHCLQSEGHSKANVAQNNIIPHYSDVIMGAIASQITSLAIVYSTVYSVADQRKHQSSASLAFVLGIHRWPMNSPHNWPVTRKMFLFDDVTMWSLTQCLDRPSREGIQ